ncbi:MAG: (d)CMP kinase [Candidatus Ranarchaeia archaeon]
MPLSNIQQQLNSKTLLNFLKTQNPTQSINSIKSKLRNQKENKITIAICGLHGTGKSTYSEEISSLFNLDLVNAGSLFRQIALEKNLSLSEFSSYVENHPEIDKEIDDRTVDAAKKGNAILDGAITAWIAREYIDLAILLTAPIDVRVNRIIQRDSTSFSETHQETVERENSEKKRFKKLYDIDIDNWDIFDLVINTEKLSIPETRNIILFVIDQFLKSKKDIK